MGVRCFEMRCPGYACKFKNSGKHVTESVTHGSVRWGNEWKWLEMHAFGAVERLI